MWVKNAMCDTKNRLDTKELLSACAIYSILIRCVNICYQKQVNCHQLVARRNETRFPYDKIDHLTATHYPHRIRVNNYSTDKHREVNQ